MKIVFLDAYPANHGEIDWAKLNSLGDVSIFNRTKHEHLLERAGEAEIIITNKLYFGKEEFQKLPELKYICVSATGYNNIDVVEAKQAGILVSNVVGYSTDSVAQHVFALLLALVNKTADYAREVHAGEWADCADFSYYKDPIRELTSKTFGIYGLGKIGRKVAKIALAFGMNVLAVHKHPTRDKMEGVEFVSMDELLCNSDVLSLHAPLTEDNKGLFDETTFQKMKRTSLLINTSRGPVIDEKALAEALKNKTISGAGLDVLSLEPPQSDNPLFGIDNCLITPHHAWASQEARERLIDGICENIKSFKEGKPINVVS